MERLFQDETNKEVVIMKSPINFDKDPTLDALREAIKDNEVKDACKLFIQLHIGRGKNFTASDLNSDPEFFIEQAKIRSERNKEPPEAYKVFFEYEKNQNLDDMSPLIIKMAAIANDIDTIKSIFYKQEYTKAIKRPEISPIAAAIQSGADDNLIRFLYAITENSLRGAAIADALDVIAAKRQLAGKEAFLEELRSQTARLPSISEEIAKSDRYIRVKVAIATGESNPAHMITLLDKHKVHILYDLEKDPGKVLSLIESCVKMASETGHFDTLNTLLKGLEEVTRNQFNKNTSGGLFTANSKIDELHGIILKSAREELLKYAEKLESKSYNDQTDNLVVQGLINTIQQFRSCREPIFTANETFALGGLAAPLSKHNADKLVDLIQHAHVKDNKQRM